MKYLNRASATGLAAAASLGLLLAACGQGDETQAGDRLDGAAAPTYPGEGAEGLVEMENEGVENDAIDQAPEESLNTGQGQTPEYGEPGGAPTEVHSDPVSPAGLNESPAP